MKDDKFTGSMLNTMLYTVGTVPLSVALATVLAVLLNQKIKGMVFYRTFYFIPVITMPIAVGISVEMVVQLRIRIDQPRAGCHEPAATQLAVR